MAIQSHPLTYADLERERETRSERLELIEGEIFVTPAPSLKHQHVVLRLGGVFEDAIVDSGLGVALPGPADIFLGPHTILQPDFVILVDERAEMYERGRIEGPPSLAIEILSPTTGERDRKMKRDLYARYGVPEYWIIDLDSNSVTSFSEPVEGRYQGEFTARDLVVSATIPSLVANLKLLFAPPRRFQRER